MLAESPGRPLDCAAICASSFWWRGFRKTEIRTGAAGDAWPTTFAAASERCAEPAIVAMCGDACAWWVWAWAGCAATTAATAPARAKSFKDALTSGSNLGTADGEYARFPRRQARRPLCAGEQVLAHRGEPLEVVHVVVEQGHLDDRFGTDPGLQALDVGAVAIRQGLEMEQALGGPAGDAVRDARGGQRARRPAADAAAGAADVASVHLVHDDAAEGQVALAQRPPEEVGLGHRLVQRHGDEQECRLGGRQEPRDLLGAAAEALVHAVEAGDELRDVGQEGGAGQPLDRAERHAGAGQRTHAQAPGPEARPHQQSQRSAVDEPGDPPRRLEEVEGMARGRRV